MNPRQSSSPPGVTGKTGNRGPNGNRGMPGIPGKRPAASEVPARPSAAQQLDALADGIEKFKIDFERFFAGAAVVPPDEQRAKLVRDLRELRNANLRAAADQFRLAALEARFNSYSELFHRRLRDLEEGRGARPPRPKLEAPRRLDAAAGIVVTDRLEPEAVDALYRGLTRQMIGRSPASGASGTGAAPVMELTTFRGYLSQQIESIRLKTGCEAVQFRIATENGKLKLKAKPVSK